MPRSIEYWEDRAAQVEANAEQNALDIEGRIKRASKGVIARVNQELELFYKRYANDNRISLSDSRKRLNVFELKEFNALNAQHASSMEKHDKDWFNSQPYNAIKSRNVADTFSKRLYVTRLQALKQNILMHVDTLNVDYEYELGKTLDTTFVQSYNATMYNIQKGIGVGFDFNQVGAKQIEQAAKTKHHGENYSSSIWKDRQILASQLDLLLEREFVSGQGYREVSRQLSRKLEIMYGQPVKKSHVERLVRTEINYIANQSTLSAYKETGFLDMYMYTATLDKRTSQICATLDGSVFPTKEASVGINYPPMHAYCRSTTIPHFEPDDIDEAITDRVHRDSNGKSVKLGEDMTYKQWSKVYAPTIHKKYFVDAKKPPRNPEPKK